MNGKEWANESLLVRIVKPLVDAYASSSVNRGLNGLGRLWRSSSVRGYMARVAHRDFYTETSLFYRALHAIRKRRDKSADAFHKALREPASHSGLYGATTTLYRAASRGEGRYAAIGAVLVGFGLAFGTVSLVLNHFYGAAALERIAAGESAGFGYGAGLELDLGVQLAIAVAFVVPGALVYALRRYLTAHAKDSLLVQLFTLLLR